ncbi:acyl-CoA Delta(11) desaturase [Plodia interpunctella]|uniref:acyl-CoA Delta(11) desaturase n=1 Tax=Plodia interpunctella TaxID=58824 RepID=UPI00236851C4|nr:acyl-CoA Delta(11) desaturase-like [Plodia interpunctella]XP_053610085.1 acyl-CoA Delta(11) desaturase-like [Plodia interpunctella]XP_053610086.1 acyl-CoA Delta(11) desaturase-like [Plodia interpunctella]
MPPQVDPVVSGVLFETDTQTSDLGLAKDVSVLKNASPRKYEYVWFNIFWFLYLHVASMYGVYLALTSAKWQTNVFAFSVHLMCAIGIGAGSHRLWTHRSYKAKTPLRILLMIWQTMGFQDCIFEWARDHRTHHKYADTDADPHNAERGLFYSHMGWLCCKKLPEVIEGGRRLDLTDLYADPVVMFQKKHYMKMMFVLCFVMPTLIPVYCWGETWTNAFFIPTILRYTIGINVVWSINSFAHTFGYRPYDKSLNPRDNIGTWMICVEGFHNYHHTFPWDYRATEYPFYNMLTPTIVFIDAMAKIGQAYDLKSVSPEIIRQRTYRTGDGTHHLWGWDDPEFTEKLKEKYGKVDKVDCDEKKTT